MPLVKMMKMRQDLTVQLEAATSPGEWEDCCATFPYATAFHRYDFLQSIAPLLRCRFVPMMVLREGRPVGVVPLLVKRLGPFCTINWTPFPYIGPLVPAELIPATLSSLRLEGERLRALDHRQSFYHMGLDWPADDSIFRANGFTYSTDRTFVVPVSGRSDQDLLAAMDRNARRQIRDGFRFGIEVLPAQPEDFELMDTWSRQMYAAQGIRPPYQTGTYRQIFNSLHNAKGTVFRAARLDGQTVAVHIAFSFARRVFDWKVAVDPRHRAHYPQAALIWQGLLWARDCGALEFDMVGAPREGIAAYKRKFGAVERCYTVLRRPTGVPRLALSIMSRA